MWPAVILLNRTYIHVPRDFFFCHLSDHVCGSHKTYPLTITSLFPDAAACLAAAFHG